MTPCPAPPPATQPTHLPGGGPRSYSTSGKSRHPPRRHTHPPRRRHHPTRNFFPRPATCRATPTNLSEPIVIQGRMRLTVGSVAHSRKPVPLMALPDAALHHPRCPRLVLSTRDARKPPSQAPSGHWLVRYTSPPTPAGPVGGLWLMPQRPWGPLTPAMRAASARPPAFRISLSAGLQGAPDMPLEPRQALARIDRRAIVISPFLELAESASYNV